MPMMNAGWGAVADTGRGAAGRQVGAGVMSSSGAAGIARARASGGRGAAGAIETGTSSGARGLLGRMGGRRGLMIGAAGVAAGGLMFGRNRGSSGTTGLQPHSTGGMGGMM